MMWEQIALAFILGTGCTIAASYWLDAFKIVDKAQDEIIRDDTPRLYAVLNFTKIVWTITTLGEEKKEEDHLQFEMFKTPSGRRSYAWRAKLNHFKGEGERFLIQYDDEVRAWVAGGPLPVKAKRIEYERDSHTTHNIPWSYT